MNEQERSAATLSCRFCPMCHHVDLATTITRRETYSPRGRGLTLFAVEQGKLSWDPSVADVMYKFSADGLSRQVCAGHIDHDELVIDARRRLVAAGAAPEAVRRVRENIQKRGNPWGEPEPDLEALSGAKKKADLLVYFGPAARVRRPGVIGATAKLLSRGGVAFMVLAAEGTPGLLLHQLGEADAAKEAARALQEKIAKSGARTVAVVGADAYRVLSRGFGDVPGLKGAAVRHVSEVIAELPLKFRPMDRPVAVHDPCALARFAPCIDPPRALLRKILGRDPLELPWNREHAACSGECGGLPFTNPALAAAAARRRTAQALEVRAAALVTAGPAAATLLDNGALEVKDITEAAAEALGG
jgi:Fe-S oxidoreductase